MKDDGQKQDHVNLAEIRLVRISKIKRFLTKTIP